MMSSELRQTFGSESWNTMLTKFSPEKAARFHLWHNIVRSHTSLKSTDHIANLSWTVRQYWPYSQRYGTFQLSLVQPMVGNQCGQHFPEDNVAIIAGANFTSATSSNLLFVDDENTLPMRTIWKYSVLYQKTYYAQTCYWVLILLEINRRNYFGSVPPPLIPEVEGGQERDSWIQID